MYTPEEIRKTNKCIEIIDSVANEISKLEPTREVDIALIKLQEVAMWLGMNKIKLEKHGGEGNKTS